MNVAVVIPTFNNAATIGACLKSVLIDPAVSEIVIHDDASSDHTSDVVAELSDKRVKVIRSENNIGASRGRHRAVAATKSPWLFFLDADDYVSPCTVSMCLTAAEADALDIAIPLMMRVSDDADPRPFITPPEMVLGGEEAFALTIGTWRIASGCGAIRRSVYEAAVNGFEFYGYSDDELLSRRMLLAAGRVGAAGGVYFYRINERSPQLSEEVGRLQTTVKVLSLASSRRRSDWVPTLRAIRNHLLHRLFALRKHIDTTRRFLILSDLAKAKVPYSIRDTPYRLLNLLLKS